MTALASTSIVVTGAGNGIGRSIAIALAAHGASVVLGDLNGGAAEATAEKIRADGGTAIGLAMDITDRASVRAAITTATRQFGGLDVMFNNAGISASAPYLEITSRDLMRLLRVNGLGTLIGMQEAARVMIDQGGGKIVNTTSVAARRSSPTFPHYAASKATISSLIQSGARALGPYKITVTGFAPGIVATPLWGDVAGDDAGSALDAYTPAIPLGRVAVAADMDGAALFLAGPGSDYITGQVVIVDGGMVMV